MLTEQMRLSQPLELTTPERAILAAPDNSPPAQWAEKNIIVTDGPYAGSPWRLSASPYLGGLMDLIMQPWLRTLILIMGSQMGKTWGPLYCMWAYLAVRDPSASLLLMGDEKVGRKVGTERLIPMIERSPALAPLQSPRSKHNTATHIKLLNDASLSIAWARSVAQISTFSYKYVFLDEIAQYPSEVGSDADPMSLSKARVRQHEDEYKIIGSTTTTDDSDPAMAAIETEAQDILEYTTPCPFCGFTQPMVEEGIVWAGKIKDPRRIRAEKLARYECAGCGKLWTDLDRNEAVARGSWIGREGIVKPYYVGAQLAAWHSPQVSLSECAATKLEGETSRAKKKYYTNHFKAEKFKDEKTDRNYEEIKDHSKEAEHRRGECPLEEIAAITAGIDVQRNGCYLVIRAWGHAPDLTSWLILDSFVQTYKAVGEVTLESSFYDTQGKEYIVNIGLMDSGDGETTVSVYDWTRANKPIHSCKGAHRKDAMIWRATRLEAYPDGRPIPGGQRRYDLGVTNIKFELARKMNIAPGLPGSFNFHSQVTDDYAKQMCAEFVDDDNTWKCKSGHANHYWDCEVYAYGAMKIIESQLFKKPPPKKPAQPKAPQTRKAGPASAPNWFNRR